MTIFLIPRNLLTPWVLQNLPGMLPKRFASVTLERRNEICVLPNSKKASGKQT